jgi:hypothetical protein
MHRRGIQEDRPLAITLGTHIRLSGRSAPEDLGSFECGDFVAAEPRAVQSQNQRASAERLQVRRIASCVGWWDRQCRDPGDEGIDARVHLSAQIVAAGQCLAESKPQFLERHTGRESLLDQELT